MTVHERSIGDVTILDVDGRITVQEGVAVFRDTLSRLLDGGWPKIMVNFAAVPYIHSTALGELYMVHECGQAGRRAEAAPGDFSGTAAAGHDAADRCFSDVP